MLKNERLGAESPFYPPPRFEIFLLEETDMEEWTEISRAVVE